MFQSLRRWKISRIWLRSQTTTISSTTALLSLRTPKWRVSVSVQRISGSIISKFAWDFPLRFKSNELKILVQILFVWNYANFKFINLIYIFFSGCHRNVIMLFASIFILFALQIVGLPFCQQRKAVLLTKLSWVNDVFIF